MKKTTQLHHNKIALNQQLFIFIKKIFKAEEKETHYTQRNKDEDENIFQNNVSQKTVEQHLLSMERLKNKLTKLKTKQKKQPI